MSLLCGLTFRIRLLALLVLLGLCYIARGQERAQSEATIDTARPLTPDKAMTIILSPSLATTLLFPAQVAMVSGFGIQPPGQAGGLVEMNYPAGSPLIELRALSEFAHVTMTVMVDHKLYVFDLRMGLKPDAAITFVRSGEGDAPGHPVTMQQVAEQRPTSSDASLISYMLLARESDAIKDDAPQLYQDYASRSVNYVSDNGKIKTTVTKVHRWSKADVIVLEGLAENKSPEPMRFDGRVTTIEVANEIHPVKSIEGLHRAILPGTTVSVCAVIQGDYDGTRLNASIDNEFRIILPDPLGRGTVWGLKNGRPLTGKVDNAPPVKKAELIPTSQTKLAKEAQR